MSTRRLKFLEFYSWLFIDEPERFIEERQISEPMRMGLDNINTLAKCTNGFANLSKENLVNCLLSETQKVALEILDALRVLTHTSKMNFQTFFLMRLKEKGLLEFQIAPSIRGTLTLKVKDPRGKVQSRPTHKTFIKIIKDNPKIAEECIDFFCDKGLKNVLDTLGSIYMEKGWKLVLDLCSSFAQKGPSAEKRGEYAERIIHKKLISWGLRADKDFNTRDIPLVEVIERKLRKQPDLTGDPRSLIDRLNKENTTRRLDLVVPLNNPMLISQNVFYTSNTGGIASKKADQVLNTKSILDEYIPNRTQTLLFVGFIDGQGWIDMRSALDKSFDNFDDFFQIKTTDTKLRTLLREKGILTPLDVELATFRCSEGRCIANMDLVLRRLRKEYSHSVINLTDLVERTVRMRFLEEESDSLVISENRKETVKAFHLLDLLLLDGFENFSQKLDRRTISDLVLNTVSTRDDVYLEMNEIKKTINTMMQWFITKTFTFS